MKVKAKEEDGDKIDTVKIHHTTDAMKISFGSDPHELTFVSLKLRTVSRKNHIYATATLVVTNTFGDPLENVTIKGSWADEGAPSHANTDSYGTVIFNQQRAQDKEDKIYVFKFLVKELYSQSYIYYPNDDHHSEISLTINLND